jgi:hypothetical protein
VKPQKRVRKKCAAAARLLDFGFLELDVLARDRVVLLEREFLGRCARVLLGHVEKSGSSGTDQLDLLRCRFCHLDLFNNRCVMRFAGNLATRDLKSSLASPIAVAGAHHDAHPFSDV